MDDRFHLGGGGRMRPGRARASAAALAALAACAAAVGLDGAESATDARSPRVRLEGAALAAWRAIGGNPPRYDIVLLTARRTRVLTARLPTGTRPELFGRISWSPDGRQLAFAAETGEDAARFGNPTDIFVVDAEEVRVRRLTDRGDAFAPRWSPDGRTIAFGVREIRLPSALLRSSIWLMNADGTAQRQLVPPVDGQVDVPGDWSPDATRLAFTRFRLSRDRRRLIAPPEIFAVSEQGTDLRRLAKHAADPAWSPDGRRIAFVSDRDRNGKLSYGDSTSYANELYSMRARGAATRRLTRTWRLNEAAPAWSPDGRAIAYQRGRVIGNAEGTIVMLVRPDGHCPRALAADPRLAVWYASPAWRPNGRLRFGACS